MNALRPRRRHIGKCGRRYLVNSTFDALDKFYRFTLHMPGTWIGDRKWHGRLKALKRSRMAHGHGTDMIGLAEIVTKEWLAS